MKRGLILLTLLMAMITVSYAADKLEDPKSALTDTTLTQPNAATITKDTTATHKVVAYYFHGNKRCVSCRKIEAFTKGAIDSVFAANLKSGTLEWRVVNTDSSQNEHYLDDYKMYTKSVILSDLHGGKETRWKNLEKVWELLGDQNEFSAYIKSELTPFLDSTK